LISGLFLSKIETQSSVDNAIISRYRELSGRMRELNWQYAVLDNAKTLQFLSNSLIILHEMLDTLASSNVMLNGANSIVGDLLMKLITAQDITENL